MLTTDGTSNAAFRAIILILWKRLRFNPVRRSGHRSGRFEATPYRPTGLAIADQGLVGAVHHATGIRARDLPITPDKVLLPFSSRLTSLPENRPSWKLVSAGGKLKSEHGR